MIPLTEPKFSMNLVRLELHETCHEFQRFGFFVVPRTPFANRNNELVRTRASLS